MADSSKAVNYPCIDIIIPTLNAANVLEKCLISIKKQQYPHSKIRILIIDGGSTDFTIKIAKKYQAKVLFNPLKTAEAAKAIGIKNLKSNFFALIDSDNILPNKKWLMKMLLPLIENESIVGSEPWKYTYRKNGGFIERYSSLTGVNDPYTLIIGNFDRKNYLFPNWTNIKINQKEYQDYLLIELDPNKLLPTIGANGTIFRSNLFKNFNSDYFFDVDFIYQLNQKILFAKVKVGIIHTFCESSIKKFIRKQNRRIKDAFFYQKHRNNPVLVNKYQYSIKFVLYTVLIFPPIYSAIKGFIKKPDIAWFFHPIACYLTLFCYSFSTLFYYLGFLKPVNRNQWQQ